MTKHFIQKAIFIGILIFGGNSFAKTYSPKKIQDSFQVIQSLLQKRVTATNTEQLRLLRPFFPDVAKLTKSKQLLPLLLSSFPKNKENFHSLSTSYRLLWTVFRFELLGKLCGKTMLKQYPNRSTLCLSTRQGIVRNIAKAAPSNTQHLLFYFRYYGKQPLPKNIHKLTFRFLFSKQPKDFKRGLLLFPIFKLSEIRRSEILFPMTKKIAQKLLTFFQVQPEQAMQATTVKLLRLFPKKEKVELLEKYLNQTSLFLTRNKDLLEKNRKLIPPRKRIPHDISFQERLARKHRDSYSRIEYEQIKAMQELCKYAPKKAIPSAKQLLQIGVHFGKKLALRCLGSMGSVAQEVTPLLLRLLQSKHSPSTFKEAVLQTIGDIGGYRQQALPVIRKYLKRGPFLQRAAIDSLRAYTNEKLGLVPFFKPNLLQKKLATHETLTVLQKLGKKSSPFLPDLFALLVLKYNHPYTTSMILNILDKQKKEKGHYLQHAKKIAKSQASLAQTIYATLKRLGYKKKQVIETLKKAINTSNISKEQVEVLTKYRTGFELTGK